MKSVLAFGGAILAFAANAVTVQTYDVTAGEQTVDVSTLGADVQIRKTGAGVLKLTGAGAYSGGIDFRAGEVWALSEGALGTGAVTYGTTEKMSLVFCADGATFANAIVFAAYAQPFSEQRGQIEFRADTTLTGTIAEPPSGTSGKCWIRIGVQAGQGHAVNLDGALTFPNSWLSLLPYGTLYLNGDINAGQLAFNTGSYGYLGTVHFSRTVKTGSYGRYTNLGRWNVINLMSANLVFDTPNAYDGGRWVAYNRFNVDENLNSLNLNGNALSVMEIACNGIDTSASSRTPPTAPNEKDWLRVWTPADKPAKLTVTGIGSNGAGYNYGKTEQYHAFSGALSVDFNGQSYTEYTLRNRTHLMTGTLAVNGGKLITTGATSFPNVPTLTVAAGATFEATSTAKMFPSCKSLTVDGTLAFTSDPGFSRGAVALGADASLTLPSETVLDVGSLTVDGVAKPTGLYSEANVPQIKAGRIFVRGDDLVLTEPVTFLQVEAGKTNSIDELIVTAPTAGTVLKTGGGVVTSSDKLKDFAGQIVIAEGGFSVNGNGQTGPQDAATAPAIRVLPGASFVLAEGAAQNQLKLYNSFRLAGTGLDGRGAIDNELTTSQYYAFIYAPSVALEGDARIGGTGTAQIGFRSSFGLNEHVLEFHRADAGSWQAPFLLSYLSLSGAGSVVVNGARLQLDRVQFGTAVSSVNLVNGAELQYEMRSGGSGANTALRFAPGGGTKLTLVYSYTKKEDPQIWSGPVEGAGTVAGGSLIVGGPWKPDPSGVLAAAGGLAFGTESTLTADDPASPLFAGSHVIAQADGTLGDLPVLDPALVTSGWKLMRSPDDPNRLVLFGNPGSPELFTGTPLPVPNAGFESVTGTMPTGWTAGDGSWHAEEGTGFGGGNCLAYERAETARANVNGVSLYLDRNDFEPGRRYLFSAKLFGKGLKVATEGSRYMGITLALHVNYAEDGVAKQGEWYARYYVHGESEEWYTATGFSDELPDGITSVSLIAMVISGGTSGDAGKGKALIDDITLARWDPPPVEWVKSTSYRDEAEGGPVTFKAALNLESAEDCSAVFTYLDADGRSVETPGTVVSATEARAVLDADGFPLGTNAVVCTLRRGDAVLGAASVDFVRLSAPSVRKVRVDSRNRLVVDGKPFFPVGMFVSDLWWNQSNSQALLRHYVTGGFNMIMPYKQFTVSVYDWVEANTDLKVICSVANHDEVPGEDYEVTMRRCFEEAVDEMAKRPSLIAWYMSDERSLFEIPTLVRRAGWMKELDPDHPMWGVIDNPTKSQHYAPTFDILGVDSYPVPSEKTGKPIGTVFADARAGLAGTHGTEPLWMVPQAFGWNWFDPGQYAAYRAPTTAETEQMAWQSIAAGANGVVFYSYTELKKDHSDEPDALDWDGMTKIVSDIRKYENVFTARDGDSAVLTGTPAGTAARLWSTGGVTYVLVVNCTGGELSDIEISLPEEHRRILGCDFGSAPALTNGNRLVFGTLEPLGFRMVRLRKGPEGLILIFR